MCESAEGSWEECTSGVTVSVPIASPDNGRIFPHHDPRRARHSSQGGNPGIRRQQARIQKLPFVITSTNGPVHEPPSGRSNPPERTPAQMMTVSIASTMTQKERLRGKVNSTFCDGSHLKRYDASDTDCGGYVTCLCVRTACVALLRE